MWSVFLGEMATFEKRLYKKEICVSKVLGISGKKQAYEKSCWAACIRMVLAYDKLIVTSDDTLATKCGVNVNECQDAAVMMTICNIYDSTDDEAIVPSFDEIVEEIDKGRPIIQCVSEHRVLPGASTTDGHYILIIGYDSENNKIVIVDPADGEIQYCNYQETKIHLTAYGGERYFAQPYYTKKGKPF